MRKILLLFTTALFSLTVLGQNYIQKSNTNPGSVDFVHDGSLTIKSLAVTNIFTQYSKQSGFTNRRLTLNTNEGDKAYIYYYDPNATTFHTINIGSSNSLNTGLTVLPNGNIGVNYASPSAKLQIAGATAIDGNYVTAIIGNAYNYWTYFGGTKGGRIRGSNEGYLVIDGNPNGSGNNKVYLNSGTPSDVILAKGGGNVGIGIATPSDLLDLYSSVTNQRLLRLSHPGSPTAAAGFMGFVTSGGVDNNGISLGVQYSSEYYDVITMQRSTRNVGIGTTSPGSYKLAVEGKIGAHEVVVTTDGWADFVFEDNYELMSLADLKAFIKTNKYLPEIPTADEVKENGVSVGEMNAKLLQKIEELTLYTIEQQEVIETLKSQLEAQNKRIIQLENLNK